MRARYLAWLARVRNDAVQTTTRESIVKKFVIGIVLAALILVGAASAAITKNYYLNFGDTAITSGGDVQCEAIIKNWSSPALVDIC